MDTDEVNVSIVFSGLVLTSVQAANSTDYNNTVEDNTTNETLFYSELKQPAFVIVIYSFAYAVVFLFAFFGNMCVVGVVWRNQRMHNVTNFFIVNLAVSDILVAVFVVPITLLANLYTEWIFGSVMCKAVPYLQGISVCASVNTLAAIAIDRYLAICHPLSYKMTTKMARSITCFIWTFAMTVMIPWAIFYRQEQFETELQTLYVCYQKWPVSNGEKVFFGAGIFLFCYMIPLILIMICYALIGCRVWNREAPGICNSNSVIQKSKVKVVKMLAVVVVMFALSWLPLYVTHSVLYYDRPSNDEAIRRIIEYIIPLAQWLGAANSGINPIIYCLFSKKIRRGIKTMITCDKSSDFRTQFSRYSSTRYVSVDYTNGHVTFRTSDTRHHGKPIDREYE